MLRKLRISVYLLVVFASSGVPSIVHANTGNGIAAQLAMFAPAAAGIFASLLSGRALSSIGWSLRKPRYLAWASWRHFGLSR